MFFPDFFPNFVFFFEFSMEACLPGIVRLCLHKVGRALSVCLLRVSRARLRACVYSCDHCLASIFVLRVFYVGLGVLVVGFVVCGALALHLGQLW